MMRSKASSTILTCLSMGFVISHFGLAWGQAPTAPRTRPVAPPSRLATRPVDDRTPPQTLPVPQRNAGTGAGAQHPLEPAVQLARRASLRMKDVRDYTAVLVKRERIDGELTTHESLFLKVRHEPFSVYIYCLGPTKPKGQEAIYVAGMNNNQVQAHSTGLKKWAGTFSLEPNSARMMEGNLYPLTNIGIQNMTERLLNRETDEMAFGECEVKFYEGAKIDSRLCTCVEIVPPVPRKNFKFHRTRVFYDNEWQIPVRTENCGWPTEAGTEPPVMEEYTYQKLQLNRGLTDLDFDVRNPSYAFE